MMATMEWIADSQPEVVAGLVALVDETWHGGHLTPGVLELARLRVGWLLGSARLEGMRLGPVPEDFEATVATVMTGSLEDLPADLRLVVTAADHFVMDAHGIDDALVAELTSAYGRSGVAALVVGMGLAESLERLAVTVDLPPVAGAMATSAALFGAPQAA